MKQAEQLQQCTETMGIVLANQEIEPSKSTFCSICKGSNFRKKITDHITRLIRGHLRYYKSKHLFNGKCRRKTGYTGSTPFLMA